MNAITSYKVEWWLPLASEPGEWTGRWRRVAGRPQVREVALAAIREGAALGLVLITATSVPAAPILRSALDEGELQAWAADACELPAGARDVSLLPPVGREDIEGQTLVRLREALLIAHEADLLHRIVVSAILDIVQQAFQGIGPAVEVAAAISRDIECPTRSRAP